MQNDEVSQNFCQTLTLKSQSRTFEAASSDRADNLADSPGRIALVEPDRARVRLHSSCPSIRVMSA